MDLQLDDIYFGRLFSYSALDLDTMIDLDAMKRADIGILKEFDRADAD